MSTNHVPKTTIQIGDILYKYEYTNSTYEIFEFKCTEIQKDGLIAILTNQTTNKMVAVWRQTEDWYASTKRDAALIFVKDRQEWIQKHLDDIKRDSERIVRALEETRDE